MAKKSRVLLSFGYWFGSRSLGLLMHPYQSVRAIRRDDFYKPLVWLPSVLFLGWWFMGFLIGRVDVLLGLGLGGLARGLSGWGSTQIVLSFIFVWGAAFLVIWQVMLLYLDRRFSSI